MKEDLLIKELTHDLKNQIKYKVSNSIEVDLENMIDEALKRALRLTLTVPEDGYYGQIGVVKEVPVRNSDLVILRPQIRASLNEALLKAQSDKLIKTIGTTAAISLVKGAFEAEEEKFVYSYHEYAGKIMVRVEIDRTHYITISVHLSSNMLSDVDKIIPAAKKAREMVSEYGADFLIQRAY